MDLHEEEFSISELVSDVESTVQGPIVKNANQFIVDVGDDVGKMLADLTKTKQILFNFISNAAKFTKQGNYIICISSGRCAVGLDSLFGKRHGDWDGSRATK